MRFLIIDSDYPAFLNWLYSSTPGLAEQGWQVQKQAQDATLFGTSPFCAENLQKLGYDALDIHVNNEPLQRAWAVEHGVLLPSASEYHFRLRRGFVPWVSKLRTQRWLYQVLAEQIKYYKPDVILNQAMDFLSSRFLREMKSNVRLLVGQIAAPIPPDSDFSCYDLIISSLPNFVDAFRKAGLPSELSRLAFEPRILDRYRCAEPTIPVSHIGSLSAAHRRRLELLKRLSELDLVQVWADNLNGIEIDSRLRQCWKGSAWGCEMFGVMARSRMTLNCHIEIAGDYANNMRLFEATGVGTLLITDQKSNLSEMFLPDREVVVYRTPDECVEKIRYYLEHEADRQDIAAAGQRRTLSEHTYLMRMQELTEIIMRHLN